MKSLKEKSLKKKRTQNTKTVVSQLKEINANALSSQEAYMKQEEQERKRRKIESYNIFNNLADLGY
jgi:hypothetical protein